MKTNQSIKNIYNSSLLLLCVILLTVANQSKAQTEPTHGKLSKYELSVDLVPVIDQGQFGKVYFKMNNYKENELKGTFRIGISKGLYSQDNIDESTYPDNTTSSYDKYSHFEAGLSIGFEKYMNIGPIATYCGLDILGRYYKDHHTPTNYTDDQEIFSFGICPFVGIKHYIVKNRISTSFEIGWENMFSRNENQYDGQAFDYFQSELRLPYSFTLNYHF